MKKRLLLLVATLTACLSLIASTNMCVKLEDGQIVKFDVDKVLEVYYEAYIHPDTNHVVPPFIDPSVADSADFYPLMFRILTDSTVELSNVDYEAFYDHFNIINIPAKVRLDGKVYDVTSVGDYVIGDWVGQFVESIEIPSSVTTIGHKAFAYCGRLTSIIIPEGVTSISDFAFSYCSSLTSITIPESVTEIGSGAFDNCDNLKPELLVYDNGTKCYGWIGNKNSCISVVIPESVTKIGSNAFSGCSSLTSVEIPSSVTEIGSEAFYYCKELDVVIDNSEENVKVGSRAFDGVKSVTWKKDMDSSSVADTSAYAPLRFQITSDSTVELTHGENWDSYRNLDSVNIPAKVRIDGKIYDVTGIGSSTFEGNSSLTSIVIPESVTEIGSGAFDGCSSLTSITIPGSVTEIGSGAFYHCRSLTSITIPESVTEIGEYAFGDCNELDIVIENSKENVKFLDWNGEETTMEESYAFYDVKSVTWKK